MNNLPCRLLTCPTSVNDPHHKNYRQPGVYKHVSGQPAELKLYSEFTRMASGRGGPRIYFFIKSHHLERCETIIYIAQSHVLQIAGCSVITDITDL